MANTIFSTVDQLTSRLNPIDSLINSIASRFLAQKEAAALAPCPSGTYLCGTVCSDDYCRPTGDLNYSTLCNCCDSRNQFAYAFICGCDDCIINE